MQQQGRRTLKATRARRPHTDYTGLKERNRAESGQSEQWVKRRTLSGSTATPSSKGIAGEVCLSFASSG